MGKPGIDFSALDAIAYRGIGTESARELKHELVEKGYTVIEPSESPFSDDESTVAASTLQASGTAPEAIVDGNTAAPKISDGMGRYKKAYRIAYSFHERHLSPQTEEEWQAAAEDLANLTEKCSMDRFTMALLNSVYAEFERISRE